MAKKPVVDIVIPVYYKEASHLEQRVQQQVEFFKKHLTEYSWKIVIANNGPRKDAVNVAKDLGKKYKQVAYSDINNPGRGWSLSTTWLNSNADIVMYMDADLATNLNSVPTMLDLLRDGKCDVAIGSRYVQGADARRTQSRYLLSKGYNIMLRYVLGLRVLDAQCGFKGIKKSVAEKLIPLTKDRRWFFDTELLYVAQRCGFHIIEIPVEWEEQEETSVQIVSVIADYVKNILRLLITRPVKKP